MMYEYTVYFSIYGKKFKTSVFAHSESEAKDIVKGKVIIHKVSEVVPDPMKMTDDGSFNYLMDIFGFKK